MKFLLVGVNASYSHTCLAVRSICEYVNENAPVNDDFVCNFAEFTINQPIAEIYRGISQAKPDVILFATYIWNAEFVCKLIADLKKIIPNVLIFAGGPEFGFAPQVYFSKLPDLDLIICGEGEKTVCNLFNLFAQTKNKPITKVELIEKINQKNINGLYFVQNDDSNQKINFTGAVDLIHNLDELPFAYPDLSLENKIFYYESSRGCPYSCSYCMSSLDKRVRFLSLERVFSDLQKFLDANVSLVKFVDRTYNLQEERYIAIWKYIVEHHNKKTMFHFEIEAEYLSEKALEFLQTVPNGVMQFEIGVQSANKQTLKAVNRSDNIEKLAQNVKQIPSTIHKHLDLIAGLPYEDLESFGKSYDFVMSLKPDALQLGFLKVLHGTQMQNFAQKNGWRWMENPVYETFSTPYLSYDDMIFLKDVETVTDALWNKEIFEKSVTYAGKIFGFWNFVCAVVKLGRENNIFDAPHKDSFWFEFFAKKIIPQFVEKNCENKKVPIIMNELLRYDFIITGKKGGFPDWYEHRYNKEEHRNLLEENGGVKNARLDFAHSEYEEFFIDVNATNFEKTYNEKSIYKKLIRY